MHVPWTVFFLLFLYVRTASAYKAEQANNMSTAEHLKKKKKGIPPSPTHPHSLPNAVFGRSAPFTLLLDGRI